MAQESLKRRLTAILSADVEGYRDIFIFHEFL